MSYTFLGDGVTPADGPSGVHALPLQLVGGGLGDSETYYLLMGKNVEPDEPLFDEAFAVADSTLIGGELRGDVNCDRVVDMQDGMMFSQMLLDPAFVQSGCEPSRGDLNGDGLVDGVDVAGFVEVMLR